MNVTVDQFGMYLTVFHNELAENADKYLPPELAGKLWHLSFFPCRIRGYLSTQFGLGWEYVRGEGKLEVVRGSARVEPLFLTQPPAMGRMFENDSPMFRISTGRVHLENISISDSRPFMLAAPEAHVKLVECKFSAPGWQRTVYGAELFGDRSAHRWTEAEAVRRATDEVLVALTEYKRASDLTLSIPGYINSRKSKTVLLLGDYAPSGKQRLSVLRSCLKEEGYEPFLVEDVPDILGSDLQQKVTILAGASRFIVVDDTAPAGQLTEIPLIQQNRWICIILRQVGCQSSYMTKGISASSAVIREAEFEMQTPCIAVREAAQWAESVIKSLETKYVDQYPWRIKETRP